MSPLTAAYRAELRPRLPHGYRGWPHFALTNLLLGGMALLLLWRIHGVRPLELLAIPVGFLYANAIEYLTHRYPLHRRTRGLRFIHRAHTLQHHRFFTAEDMACEEPLDFAVILFGPISQLGLILGLGLPSGALLALTLGWNVALLFVATSIAYFLLYEWLHLAYHLPLTHPLARLPLMGALRTHHLRHHDPRLMSLWNFNITFPLFDWLLGTRYLPGAVPEERLR